MGKLYDYLIVVYKFLAGILASSTTKLISIALVSFLIFAIWTLVVLFIKSQEGLHKKCSKTTEFLKTRNINSSNEQILDNKINEISKEIAVGWKNFKNSQKQKPSECIVKRDVLESKKEASIVNVNFILMKIYVAIVSIVLSMFSLTFYGAGKTLTGSIFVEAMVFPLAYFAFMTLVLGLFCFITKQFRKMDEESLDEFVEILDRVFVNKNEETSVAEIVLEPEELSNESEEVTDEKSEIEEIQKIQTEPEQMVENQEALQQIEEPVVEVEQVNKEDIEDITEVESDKEIEEDPMAILDKYDIFKKKNIDVDKIMNEFSTNENTTLPYINVDSDYVVKDDGFEGKVIVNENDDASSILGGMMQDMSFAKKENETFIDVKKEVAELVDLEENTEENTTVEQNAESENETIRDSEENEPNDVLSEILKLIDKDNYKETAQEQVDNETIKNEEISTEEKEPLGEIVENIDVVDVEENKVEEEPQTIEEQIEEVSKQTEDETAQSGEQTEDDISEKVKENIALAVSGFKSKRSKLASGGVVIERNEPITKRDRGQEDDLNLRAYSKPEVKQLDAENNADDILNSFKSSAGGYDNPYGNSYNPYVSPAYDQNYGMYQNQSYPQTPYQNPYPNVPIGGYNYQNQNYNPMPYQTEYNSNYGFEQQVDVSEYPAVEQPKKPRKPREKSEIQENKVEEVEFMSETKTRGRPKKQEVSESMTIHSDQEFDEVLSRAEKLMRKSEEGLSASQSKRIEKELSMLMDAMNRYKENN